jgi:hypothetical protein
MNLLIQHEYYKEVLASPGDTRNVELDAGEKESASEKCYTDEDMWKVHDSGYP